ncbi:MAG: PfkB family carbohydrate kinase [Streptosporangiaceae bacterium]
MTAAGPGVGRRRLVYLGNVVVDIVLDVPGLPDRGGDMFATRTRYLAGGGFNVMAAAARQGLPVSYAGAHGSGPFGDLARTALAADGIEILLPPRPDLDTGCVVALVEPGGERTFVSGRGAEATLGVDDLAGITPDHGDIIGLSGYSLAHEPNRKALSMWLDAHRGPHPVIFDPGPLAGLLPEPALSQVLARTTWLTCNEREAMLLTGEHEPALSVRALTALLGSLAGTNDGAGPAGVLVRRGPAGCLVGLPDQPIHHVPGFRVNATDTNGAGDAHTGVFIAAVAAGLPVLDAVKRANAAGAVSVTRQGPAAAPGYAELEAFLAAHDGPDE